MNIALEKYQDEPSIMQVSGYMFPVPDFLGKNEAMFLPFISSWGWATWKKSWQYFDAKAIGWEMLERDLPLRSEFNLDDSYDYFTMLKQQMNGRIDSWAIRWYWSIFQRKGLTLFPPVSYVNNIGFDGSGSHGWISGKIFLTGNKIYAQSSCLKFPREIRQDFISYQLVKKVIGRKNRFPFSILIKIKNLFS